MKPRLVVAALASIAATLVFVTTSRADPNLTNIPKHRHYVRSSTGELVEVGPRVCDNPDLQRAFNQFHNNVHAASAGSIGPAAPGVHNFVGAELMFGGC